MTRAFAVLAVMLVLAITTSSAQNALSFSGTIYALPGSSLQNTVVVACLLENNACSDGRSGVQQINSAASSTGFQIASLEDADYLLLAWRDLNGNTEADAGDEIGVYQENGRPALLRPPAGNLELRLAQFTGDLNALINQAEQSSVTSAPSSPPASSLSLSGRVAPKAGSSLAGTQVFACVLTAEWCDTARTRGARVDADGGFAIDKLERIPYVLFAWRDADGDGSLGAPDEIGVYAVNGRPAMVTPPQTKLSLRLRTGGLSDIDALRGPVAPIGSTPSGSSKNTNITGAALRFNIPRNWQNTGNGIYLAEFGKEDPNTPKGRLDVSVFAPRAKSGNLLAQTRAIWQQETKGSLDVKDQRGGLFVRRLPSGLNVGINFGTARAFENPGGGTFNSILGTYAVMFLVETGAQVTPIFFKLTRIGSGGYTGETEGTPLIESFMTNLKPVSPIKVPELYTEADFIGKWKVSSGTYNNTNLYNANTGAYVTSSFTQSAFQMRVSFRRGGSGDFFATLFMNNNGAMTRMTEEDQMRWRLSGDRITLDRPRQKHSSTYVLFGISKDDKGQPVILSQLLTGGFTGQLLTEPDDLWLVDK